MKVFPSSLWLVPAKKQLEWRISLLTGTFHTVSRIRDNAVIMQGMLSDSVTSPVRSQADCQALFNLAFVTAV